jgi:FeS assembly SUF system protein
MSAGQSFLDATLRRARIIEALKSCYDPEIPVDIWELGLVYGIDDAPDGSVTIRMTLTSPACPVAQSLPAAVEDSVRTLADVENVRVELVWDPPWTRERMSETARLLLDLG